MALSAEERTHRRSESVARYNASDKGRARRRVYEASEKGLAKNRRYKDGLRAISSSPDWTPPLEHECSTCKRTLPSDAFARRGETPTGLQYFCKQCSAERSRFEKYGLTQETYDAMIWLQDNKCDICPKSFDDEVAHVDHCHDTLAVRGLLCLGCNVSIGHFADDPALLASAISYLEMSA